MLGRDEWLDLARKLDWDYSYVDESEVFPEVISGQPWLPASRTTATFGALDELRHTEIPLLLMHEFVRRDPGFDWTHKFYHSNNWVAIAARHLSDELLVASNPIEFTIATNFVFETCFTNLRANGSPYFRACSVRCAIRCTDYR